jgi:hypothetical protein
MPPETKFDEFVAGIESANYRGALAGIMGQNPVGVERTRTLLPFFNRLEVSR